MGQRRLLFALLLAVCTLVWAGPAYAATFLELSGHVRLGDGKSPEGTKVKVQLDLDRDGKLSKFETASGSVSANGSFKLSYSLDPKKVDFEFIAFATKLASAYAKRGFAALLDKGPLAVLMTVEREGYSTVIKRFASLNDKPSLDVLLSPLRSVACADESCYAGDGSVQISGLPGGTGIAKAYAQAFDPGAETKRFPGAFADDEDSLLISSGFAEINLYDQAGKEIHELPAAVAVRFEAKAAAFKTMRDLKAKSGKIEVPMYSFDRDQGQWVRESDGELQLADGTPVKESDLEAIVAGTFKERAFFAFSTKHFSSFNCDHPIEKRACVKGTLWSGGKIVAGASVTVGGVSYTGDAGPVMTGADGVFAADVIRSEGAGEDFDENGKDNETSTVRLVALANQGVFVGATFDTPHAQGSVQAGGVLSCLPADCKCVDLGDIEATFEMPRACDITVQANFSGQHLIGSGGPLKKGQAHAKANISIELSGSIGVPEAEVECANDTCGSGTSAADGTVKVTALIVGDAPEVMVSVEAVVEEGDDLDYYNGSASIKACARGQTAVIGTTRVRTIHTALGSLGGFIDSLGAGANDALGKDVINCGCRLVAPRQSKAYGAYGLVGVALVLGVRRRRK